MQPETRRFHVPYGKSTIEFSLPPTMSGTEVHSRAVEPLLDVELAISQTLADPINSPPLRKLAHPGQRACIVFTDVTRSSPDHLLVPALLKELEAAGVRDQDITL